ncbi:N-acetylglucosamine-6-phosphate deacetylase [Microbacterium sp. EST19A]|uniref:N-acetylglucosamine-6-phosphate deacetylase n=1 Tax=Microbacterium sp. EST19A TaxID=2862681 RepID=UPI001CC04849|nr:amidohydrolase family protein [Microbacterium sp. EST19A]
MAPVAEDKGLPWLSAGLVDLQVNGFAGHDVNGETSADEVIALTAALAAVGTTTYLPTIITASAQETINSLLAVRRARAVDAATAAAVPFVHLEGPHLSDQAGPRGVHPTAHIRPPDLEAFAQLQEQSHGLIGMMTLSPHYESSAAFTSALVSRGVRVAIGHTHANNAEIQRVVKAGATLSTHLGNGAHRIIPRHPNYIWSQLAEDRLTAGFIADGHHLPDETLVSMIRAKGVERSILVSDSTSVGGLPPGHYRTAVGAEVVLDDRGQLREAEGPFLAGAALPLIAGVSRIAAHGAFTLKEAVAMATRVPGSIIGGRGEIATGSPADLVTFDQNESDGELHLRTVIVSGRLND